MTDPIADMLTRLRNAVHARHTRVDVPASRLKAEIARILEREGYIQGFKMVDPTDAATGPVIRIVLKYGPRGEKVISGMAGPKRISAFTAESVSGARSEENRTAILGAPVPPSTACSRVYNPGTPMETAISLHFTAHENLS